MCFFFPAVSNNCFCFFGSLKNVFLYFFVLILIFFGSGKCEMILAVVCLICFGNIISGSDTSELFLGIC